MQQCVSFVCTGHIRTTLSNESAPIGCSVDACRWLYNYFFESRKSIYAPVLMSLRKGVVWSTAGRRNGLWSKCNGFSTLLHSTLPWARQTARTFSIRHTTDWVPTRQLAKYYVHRAYRCRVIMRQQPLFPASRANQKKITSSILFLRDPWDCLWQTQASKGRTMQQNQAWDPAGSIIFYTFVYVTFLK